MSKYITHKICRTLFRSDEEIRTYVIKQYDGDSSDLYDPRNRDTLRRFVIRAVKELYVNIMVPRELFLVYEKPESSGAILVRHDLKHISEYHKQIILDNLGLKPDVTKPVCGPECKSRW
jgi:hypothetical protein